MINIKINDDEAQVEVSGNLETVGIEFITSIGAILEAINNLPKEPSKYLRKIIIELVNENYIDYKN